MSSRKLAITAFNIFILLSLVAACQSSDLFRLWYESLYLNVVKPWASYRMAEGCVAVAGFTFASIFFTIVEATGARKIGQKGETTQNHPLVHGSAWDCFYWVAINVVLYLGIIAVLQVPISWYQGPLVLPPEPPSLWRALVEVCFSVVSYDSAFFFIHLSFHEKGQQKIYTGKDLEKETTTEKFSSSSSWLKWWTSVHRRHHDFYQNPEAPLHHMITFHHHFVDAALQVLINVIVQQIPLFFLFSGPRHRFSRLIHNLVVTYLLVESHSGFDLFFMSHRVFPSIFGGAVKHQIHHQTGKVNFHQFFMFLDRWLETDRFPSAFS